MTGENVDSAFGNKKPENLCTYNEVEQCKQEIHYELRSLGNLCEIERETLFSNPTLVCESKIPEAEKNKKFRVAAYEKFIDESEKNFKKEKEKQKALLQDLKWFQNEGQRLFQVEMKEYKKLPNKQKTNLNLSNINIISTDKERDEYYKKTEDYFTQLATLLNIHRSGHENNENTNKTKQKIENIKKTQEQIQKRINHCNEQINKIDEKLFALRNEEFKNYYSKIVVKTQNFREIFEKWYEEKRLLNDRKNNNEKIPLTAREKTINATIALASNPGAAQLPANYIEQLKIQLNNLNKEYLNKKISLKEFDKLCTQKRLKLLRHYYTVMPGSEFERRMTTYRQFKTSFAKGQKYGRWLNVLIKEVLQFENGSFNKNNKFLSTTVPTNDETQKITYKELIKKSLQDIAKERRLTKDDINFLYETLGIVFWHESKGDPLAISPLYCIGMAQFIKSFYDGSDKRWPKRINPFNPKEAIPRATELMVINYLNLQQNENLTDNKILLEKATIIAYNRGLNEIKTAVKKGGANFQKYLAKEGKHYYAATCQDLAELLNELAKNEQTTDTEKTTKKSTRLYNKIKPVILPGNQKIILTGKHANLINGKFVEISYWSKGIEIKGWIKEDCVN